MSDEFDPYDVFGVTGARWGDLQIDRETCGKSEYLDASQEVLDLAKKVLNESEIKEAESLSEMLTQSKSKKYYARMTLMRMVLPPPKRPLYYCHFEMKFLPRWTRNIMRDLGNYIDVLVKEMSLELTNNKHCLKNPLGNNLNTIKEKIAPELYDKLIRYNNFLYVPSKHDFDVPPNRKHRFTSKETVLTTFITMKLASEIKTLSKMAQKYAEVG